MSKKQKDEFANIGNGIHTIMPLETAKSFMRILAICIIAIGYGVNDYAIEESILETPTKVMWIASTILAVIFYIYRYTVAKKGATGRQKLIISTYVFIDIFLIGILLSMACLIVGITEENYGFFILFAFVVISMFSFYLYSFLRRSKKEVKKESSKSPIIIFGGIFGVCIGTMLSGSAKDIVSIAVLLLFCGFSLAMGVLGFANLIVLKRGDVIDLDV